MAEDKKNEIITQYLSDQVGVLGHVYQAIDKQVKETKDEKDINPLLVEMRDTLERQTNEVRNRLKELGGQVSGPIKEAAASILGVAAGAIDKLRADEVSKNLRDDYTALSLVNISYTMLMTTALAVRDEQTAQLCQRNLKQTADFVERLGKVISYAVVRDLSDAANLDPDAVQKGQKMYSDAWNSNKSGAGAGSSGSY